MAIFVLLIVAYVLGLPTLAAIAYFKAKGSERRLQEVEHELKRIAQQLGSLRETLTGAAEKAQPATEAQPSKEAPTTTPTLAPTAATVIPAGPAPLPPMRASLETGAAQAPHQAAGTETKAGSLEEALTSRWLVWLGGLALALAGTFLVKYAVDTGLLGPAARVTLGFMFGMSLAIAGEWLRRRPLQRAIAAIRTNYVPPALTASGLFISFASVYAAYALYNLLIPLVAFAGLSLVALLAVGLSLLQGRFVALMGLLGAFAAPALVISPNPSAWTLFSYLLFVEAACLAVARYQSWWWFASATLAGVVVWPILWMTDPHWSRSDALPLGGYLLLTVAFYFLLRRNRETIEDGENWFVQIQKLGLPEWISWAAASATALVLFAVVHLSGYGITGLVFAGLTAALYIFLGRRESIFDSLAPVAGLLILAIAATMPLPANVVAPPALPGAPFVPIELQYYAGANGVFALLFGVFGFVALWGARRPALWAGVSAGVPVLLLVIAYYRIVAFGVDLGWAFAALALAGVSLAAADRVERYRSSQGLEITLGIYAAATVALISLATAMSIREAWLTAALSAQLPALAWINTRVRTRSLEIIAAVLACVVLSRLVLNYNILSYRLSANPATSWVIYGYGVPAIAFWWAGRNFRRLNAGSVVALLDSGALAFSVLLISLEIRLSIDGSLRSDAYGILEQSLQSIAWLSVGTALTFYNHRRRYAVAAYGSRILLGLAAAQILFLQLWASNPVSTHAYVGAYPVINLLLLAYAAPAGFAFFLAIAMHKEQRDKLATVAALAGFLLVLVYLTLETARAFQGPSLFGLGRSDAESYAYSVVWLLYALTLLGLGIVFEQKLLRYASLAVLVITAGKVFLSDMAGLTGLYRVASFLGLGLSLVGIGYLYQRFVFGPSGPAHGEPRGANTAEAGASAPRTR